ncbi:hypothetical protein HY489_04935 [Candidatus Woesearchaeota archaeon]|nr:hypothetical protein [Candidatus Woesearchaeota archaeon]
MLLTPELVRIHAHLCGDGMLCIYKSTEKDHRIRAQISYYNTNPALIASFQKDMHKQFGVTMTYIPRRFRIAVQSQRIARELLALSDYKTRTWRIPDCIKKAPCAFQIEWIKAFSHDDGYTPKDRNVIRLKCMNAAGLLDIKEILDALGIYNTFSGPNCDKTWFLNIRKEQELTDFVKVASRK